MKFSEYQEQSRTTAIYPGIGKNFIYPALGLCGESGEVAEKIKKIIRDSNMEVTDEKRQEIAKELGDVLWYLSQLATEFNLSLSEIAQGNIEKLQKRKQEGTLHGNGDNR
ncbi:nucleoside triphosphate pyrophosphohydrolase family protein [Candidatus Uhrbacteria bacterium]|nr:nucleoside triphosphate pyrophosphohydrolase family protein [Candidatus Uhrbacteria bacterium]